MVVHMSQKFLHFIRYNNAFSIGFMALFLSVGGVFAASPDVRSAVADAVIKEDTSVIATDNTYLLSVDLDTYVPAVLIADVTEDEEYYYVEYTLSTIDVEEKVWRDVEKSRVMQVSKGRLEGSDLGLYVTKQLKEVVDYELARLTETKVIEERFGTSTKIVATAYSGLVGKYLDTKEEEFPGYRPVIEPEEEIVVVEVADGEDTVIPDIQILGDNPTLVELGGVYTELGAVVTDNVDTNISLVTSGSVDTLIAGNYSVTYAAVDSAGNEAVKKRVVTVFDPSSETGSGSSTTTPPVSTSTPPVATTTPPSATTTEEVLDTTPPVITIIGETQISIDQGSVYSDEGATASDDTDGDLTAEIVTGGQVDTAEPGSYMISYSVTDSSGNGSTVSREVVVVRVSEEAPAEEPVSDETASTTP